MNSIFKKTISFILIAVFVIGCSSNISALTADKEWEDYYNSYMTDGKSVLMSPGSNETQRNFSWYSSKNSGKCYVAVSKNSDMSNSVKYSGTHISTPNGDRTNKVTVSNLEAGTTYYYQCITNDGVSPVESFNTITSSSFTAMYVTDIHVSRDDDIEKPLVNQSYTFSKVVEKANDTKKLDLIVSAGDQATKGSRVEYMSLFASPLLRSIPFAPAVGNHDRKGSAYKYFTNNPNRYTKGLSSYIGNDYWYVKGDVLFMVFDSNCTAATTHRKFIKSAIKANPNVKWRVGVMHHDLYGRLSDSRLEDDMKNRRPTFVPLFDEFKFDLVLLGHSHYYSMSHVLYNGEVTQSLTDKDSVTDANGTIYMVSGSVNHPRYSPETPLTEQAAYGYSTEALIYNLLDFSEDSIKINSYTIDSDSPFHSFTINKTSNEGGHQKYNMPFFAFIIRSALQFIAVFEEFGIMVKAIFNS